MPSTQIRTQIRHQRILDAALSVFSKRGYREAVVDDIASKAGTSKGGVYFHFPGKQAIFFALLDRSADMLFNRINERLEGEPDPISKVEVALHTLLRTFASHRILARLFLVEALGAGPDFHMRIHGIHGRFVSLIENHLNQAVQQNLIHPLDTGVASLAWFGALNQVVVNWVLEEAKSPLEDAYPTLRDLLLNSVGAPLTNGLTDSASSSRAHSSGPHS
jgi:TetR/AcrR family transcriptional regulator, fatty acid metabolism regulator protein